MEERVDWWEDGEEGEGVSLERRLGEKGRLGHIIRMERDLAKKADRFSRTLM